MSMPKLGKLLHASYRAAPLAAPANIPARAPEITFAPSPVVVLLARAPPNFSWVGIVGILAAFLVVAIIALICFWYKNLTYRKALREEEGVYATTIAIDSNGKGCSEDASKRGELILSAFEQALVDSPAPSDHFSDKEIVSCRDVKTPVKTPERMSVPNMEQEIAVYTRDRDIYLTGGFNWNPGETLVDEIFYMGDEGSQMGVRYSKPSLSNPAEFGLLRKESASTSKGDSDEACLLGTLNRSHTIEAPPSGTKKGRSASEAIDGWTASGAKNGWKLRTFSLPTSYVQKTSQGSRDVPSFAVPGDERVELQSKFVSTLTPHPTSLPSSPVHNYFPSAYNNLTPSLFNPKPSRLSHQSATTLLMRPTFIVPPSTPPPPLPLPATLDGADDHEKSMQELRRAAIKSEESNSSKWSTFNYCPSPPPPPLPVPCGAPPPNPPPPPPLPRRSNLGAIASVSLPPPPSSLNKTEARESSSPPATSTLDNIGALKSAPPSPPPPPPPPPPFSKDSRRRPSPPPPPPPHRGPRPKLSPLVLPGRAGPGGNTEGYRNGRRSPKRPPKMRPLHWDKLRPESSSVMVWDNITDSME